MGRRDAGAGIWASGLALLPLLIGGGGLTPPLRAQSTAELRGYQQRLLLLFERLDQNGDRRLERWEVQGKAYLERHFERLDQQRRGYLTPRDLLQDRGRGQAERMRRFLERADSNGNGQLDRREAEAYPWLQRRFNEADRDGDGQLNRQELQRLRRSRPAVP